MKKFLPPAILLVALATIVHAAWDQSILNNLANGTALPVANGGTGTTTASGFLDGLLGSTRGSVGYRGASGWAGLTPGTSTYVLTSNGAGADPSWAAASGGNVVDTLAATVGAGADGNNVNLTNLGSLTLASTKQLILNATKLGAGTGSPESAVTAPVGSVWLRTDGSAGTILYVKETGSSNTGWIAYGSTPTLASVLAVGADGNAVSLTNMGSYTAAASKTITIATGTFATAVNSTGTTTLGDATSDHCTITGDIAVSGGGVGTSGQGLSSGGASAATVWTGTVVGQAGVGTGGVVAVSGSLTIDSSYAGKIIDCSGGTATITVTLPTCSAGAGPFTIVDMDASRMVHVLSNSGDNIYAGGVVTATAGYWSTGGGSSTVANVGYHLTVVGLDATSWLVISGDGLWSKDGD